jgi:ABC-type polysaccharide/polyol phosphate export permease
MGLRNFFPNLLGEAREAWRYRDLLQNLVERELQVRYKNSLFGVLWSLANPIIRMLVLWVVFEHIIGVKVTNYTAYLLAAFFPWTYFLTGVLDAAESVSKQQELIKKVYFPRELLPLATTIANLRHFLLSLAILGVYLIILYAYDSYKIGHLSLPPIEIFLLPVLIVMQTLLIGGLAFFLSALNVFFEDTKFLAAVLLDLLFYAVPIMYFLELVKHVAPTVYYFYILNPMVMILAAYRRFLLNPQILSKTLGLHDGEALPINGQNPPSYPIDSFPWGYFWLAFVVCVAVFIGGYAFFNSRKWRFVEQQ